MHCPACHVALELKVAGNSVPPARQPNLADVGDLLSAINVDSLDERSSTFVKETRERYEKYHDNIKMSPKQMAWLQKLAAGGF